MISCRAACLPKGPPNRVGVGHAGVGVSYRGWVGVSYRGWVGHTGVGWVMQGWGRHARVGWGGSCRGAVGHAVHVGLITQFQKFTNGYGDVYEWGNVS